MIGVKFIIFNKNTDNIQDILAKSKIRANMPIIKCLLKEIAKQELSV